ncbi:hypothetical protein ACFLVN_01930 [Chloroflexota bacterium]
MVVLYPLLYGDNIVTKDCDTSGGHNGASGGAIDYRATPGETTRAGIRRDVDGAGAFPPCRHQPKTHPLLLENSYRTSSLVKPGGLPITGNT